MKKEKEKEKEKRGVYMCMYIQMVGQSINNA